jgi:hypothetical protein
MAEVSDRKSPERRLRFFRFGLLAVTGVAFAIAATFGYLVTVGTISGALKFGVPYGAGVGILCIIIYFFYKKFVVKAE